MLSTTDFIVVTASTTEGRKVKRVAGLRCAACGGIMDIECRQIIDDDGSIVFSGTRGSADYVTERVGSILSSYSNESSGNYLTWLYSTYWKCPDCTYELHIE